MSNAQWLQQVQESVVDPELPICDPHHHLWDYPTNRYLLDEFLQDLGGGHNIVSSVFVECGSMYRADGPVALRPVGEIEFVNGVAAMSASGRFAETRSTGSYWYPRKSPGPSGPTSGNRWTISAFSRIGSEKTSGP